MRVGGRLTRTGVLPYHLADGSVIRELRLPEEVFRADSLASLAGAPVTEMHRGGFITPGNVREHSVGHVQSDIKQDGKFVTGSVQVEDAGTIAKVTRRELVELSPGYRCKMDVSSGTYEGEPYDVIQRQIEYNHLTLLPKNQGRSGNDVALRLDGRGAGAAIAHIDHNSALGDYIRDQFSLLGMTRDQIASALGVNEFELGFLMSGFSDTDPAMMAKLASLFQVELSVLENLTVDEGATFVNKRDAQQECPTMKCTYNLDGVAYEIEVPDALAANFKAAMAKRETERQDALDKVERVEGELAASKKTGDDLQTKLDAATDPKRLAAAAAERVQLTLDCKAIAPELVLDETASARDMKVAALEAAEHKFDSKASDGFIDGLFAGAVTSAPAPKDGNAGTPRSTGVTPPVVKLDAKEEGSDAARDRMVQRNANMWQPKGATN